MPYRESSRPTIAENDYIEVRASILSRVWVRWRRISHPAYWHGYRGTVVGLRRYYGCPCGAPHCPNNSEDSPGAWVILDAYADFGLEPSASVGDPSEAPSAVQLVFPLRSLRLIRGVRGALLAAPG